MLNFRDLQGINTRVGPIRAGRVLRSDVPLTTDGAPDTSVWPPAVVIDLRSEDERARTVEDVVWGTPTRHLSVPLLADLDPTKLATEAGYLEMRRGLYCLVAEESGAGLVRVVTAVAGAPGAALIHCSAGKDRTGIAVAFLLDLLGVSDEEIVTDFLRSDEVGRAVTHRHLLAQGKDPEDLPPADPEDLMAVMGVWRGHREGVHGYAQDHGWDRGRLGELERRLTSP
ncbi:MAG: tyrosine-protein phosphatase [Nocardioides sp.]|uniref:tyrosine-protein phosphatase n=1 Tax=Nocardioides sp. TaxID=35761 RepID=UPI0039E2ADA7